ncbi:helix-turn-helix domain-containing protein [Saccharothrix sp. NPDC042600]|uniref:helix-turn-helix domain-containing protein n=1 Tax=Saccharothrix TaxID=2071 RepID=UPI0033F3D9E4
MTNHHQGPPSALWSYIQHNLSLRGKRTSDLTRALRVHRSRLTDWRNGKSLSLATARALAAYFDTPLLEVIVAAGMITAEEASAGPVRPSPASLSDAELLAEIGRRLHERS